MMYDGIGRFLLPLLLALLLLIPSLPSPQTSHEDMMTVSQGLPPPSHMSSLPDLILANLSFSVRKIIDGSRITIFATVFNDGENCNSPFYVEIRVDGKGVGNEIATNLPAGNFTIISVEWTASAGYHEISAIVDVGDEVIEKNESNNLKILYVDVPYPDMYVEEVYWSPREYRDGDYVSISAIIRNGGFGATLSSFKCYMYIDSILVGTRIISGMPQKTSTIFSVVWTAKSGAHVLKVEVDGGDDIYESDESNNIVVMVIGGSPPDIAIDNVNIPSNLTDGLPSTINVTLTNKGNTTLKWFLVSLIIDGQEYASSSVYGLPKNEKRNVSFRWVPSGGTHVVRIEADSSYDIFESVETNNVFSSVISVPMPDIVIQDLKYSPVKPHDGEVVKFGAKITNYGYSTSNIITCVLMVNGEEVSTSSLQGIEKNNISYVYFEWTATPGFHDISVIVDFFDKVSEMNESNNMLVISVFIPYPNIVVDSVSMKPINASYGEKINISATIRNVGENTSRNFHVHFFLNGVDMGDVPLKGLSHGRSYNISFVSTAPGGNISIASVADLENYIVESNETDNFAKTYAYIHYPDLIVSDFSWSPGNATYGMYINITAKIKNVGGDCLSSFFVEIFSNKGPITNVAFDKIYSGQEYVLNYTFLVSERIEKIGCLVDGKNSVDEYNEANNEIIRIFPGGNISIEKEQIDVSASSIELLPTNISCGQKINVIAHLNLNILPKKPLSLSVALHLNGKAISEKIVRIASISDTVAFTIVASSGIHDVEVIVDSSKIIQEVDESNNVISTLFYVPFPDFRVESISVYPSSLTDGENANIFVQIRNAGGDSFASTNVRCYIDSSYIGSKKIDAIMSEENYTVSFRWTSSPGKHRISVYCDYENNVYEYDDLNYNYTQISVGFPNIKISSVSTPSYANLGEKVTIRAKVINDAKMTTLRDFSVSFFADGEYIGYYTISGLMGGDYVYAFTDWIPTPGCHVIYAVADATFRIRETDESDNQGTFKFINISVPDIKITNFNITPYCPIGGSDSLIEVFLESDQYIASSFYVSLYLDGTYHSRLLVPGMLNSSATFTEIMKIPAGSHKIYVMTDSTDKIYESNEYNNHYFMKFEVSNFPDLQIKDLKLPTNIVDGENVKIFAEIENLGGPFYSNFIVAFYVDGKLIGTQSIKGMMNDVISVSADYLVVGGLHSVRVIVDYGNVIKEKNEMNNEMHKLGMMCEPADIAVREVICFGSPDSYTIFAKIENIGGDTLSQSIVAFYADDVLLGVRNICGISSHKWTYTSISSSVRASFIKVIVDFSRIVLEGDEENNEYISPLKIIPIEKGLPDLTVSFLDISQIYPSYGKSVGIIAQIANLGNTSIIEDFDVVLIAGGKIVEHYVVHGMPPEDDMYITFEWDVSSISSIQVYVDYVITLNTTGAVAESNERNNMKSMEIDPTKDVLLSDLTVDSVVVFNTFTEGKSVMFIYVSNIGIGDLLNNFYVDVYYAGEFVHKVLIYGLLSGHTFVFPVMYKPHAGESDYGIYIDALMEISELDEGNNNYIFSDTRRYPDIVVEDMWWISNERMISVYAWIRNNGSSFMDEFYTTFLVDGSVVSAAKIRGLLEDSRTLLIFSYDISPGNHTLEISTDSTDEILELNELNNKRKMSYPMGEIDTNVTLYNLRIGNISFIQKNERGKNLYIFSGNVTNTGNSSIDSYSINIILDGISVDSIVMNSLSPNETANFTYNLYPSVDNHTVRFYVDMKRKIAENDESDNDYLVILERNSVPIAIAGANKIVYEGDHIEFNGIGIDHDGVILLYEWDFDGDGFYEWKSNTSGYAKHVYYTEGKYIVHFRVTDDDNAYAEDSLYVLVKKREALKVEEVNIVVVILVLIVLFSLIFLAIYLYKRKEEIFRE